MDATQDTAVCSCEKMKSVASAEYDLARIKYESELRREDSLIQQSGHMQSAFAFTTAALFMVLPVLLQYRGTLSLEFCLLSIASITLMLLCSLFGATMAQNRKEQALFPNSTEIIKYIEENEELFSSDIQRYKYYANTYSAVQESLTKINRSRVKQIKASMWCFYAALLLCVFWFVVGVIKII